MSALTAVKVNQHRKYNAIHGIKFKYKHDRFEQRKKQRETVKLEKQHLFTLPTNKRTTPFPTNCNNPKQPTTFNMNNNKIKSTANTNMTDNLTNPVSNVQKKSDETKKQAETVKQKKQHLFTYATKKPATPFPTNCNNLTEPTTSNTNNNNMKSVTNANMTDNLTNPVNNVKKKEPRNKKAEGNRYYSYDQNGNVIAERDGSHATAPDIYRPYYYDGDIYSTDYGFGVVRPQGNIPNDGVYQRNYRWNERNLLTESSDSAYTVNYRYGADGQRALKHVVNNNITTLYFNKMWTKSSIRENWLQSKHIYLGEERIATKFNVGNNTNTADEQRRIYYYHTDHLGSAQTITNYQGVLHERLEYTPYGELWINYIADTAPQDATPFRFTGQELDKETGLYYYGARYLDPRTSRWMSTDPAMYQGDYIPGAPANDEARKRNGNLPGMGGVYNYVNLHVYHYAGNNPIKYVDPDGNVILSFEAHFLMTDYPDTLLGNSQSVYISKAGCYITTFANIGLELKNRRLCGSNYGSVEKSSVLGINSMKNIFLNDSAFLAGRDKSMNTIFGVGRWDWFTKAGQANKGGLLARLEEFQNCSQGYMIMGIFDLSSLDPKLKTHMVGITGLPGEDGVFNPSNIVPSSINDRYRLLDPAKASAYNMNTLMELRILKTDDERR